jgi:hypothetical protein
VALSITAADGGVPERDHSAASAGAQTYRTWCVSCHGEGGRGDGPLVPLLAAPLPDLRTSQLASFLASIQRQNGIPGTASALCVFAHPAYAGRCTETVPLAEGSSPRAACEQILACLNSAVCVKVYCGATTIRQGWTLVSARRIVVQP